MLITRRLRHLNNLKRCISSLQIQNNSYSSKAIPLEYGSDPQPLFTDPETQSLLKSMTQLQIYKVFRKTTVPDNSIEYKFMTTEQLEQEFRKTIERAKNLLQMPPVVQIKEDTINIISKDSALKDFSDTKYVFTDISYGLRQCERKVIVRQINGTLEYAPMEVTKRMHQLYVPLPGRNIRKPRMFEDEYLKRCLEEQKYEFILNCLTVQYEPFEREFHEISGRVYQHLNETKQFDVLRSTRHFGPMAFYYAWHRCIDDLLYDMVKRDFLQNGVELIALMYKIHKIPIDYASVLSELNKFHEGREPVMEELMKPIKKKTNDIHEEIKTAIGKSKEDFEADDICLQFIEKYISEHGLKKVQLELALQTFKEANAEKKQLYEGLKKAHGIELS